MHRPPRSMIIPAAGMGTRLGNLVRLTPKEALPLGDRPAIEGALLEAAAAEAPHSVLVARAGPDPVRAWVEAHGRAHVAVQPTPLGVSDAIERGRARLPDAAEYAVLYPDYVHLPDQDRPATTRRRRARSRGQRCGRCRPGHVVRPRPHD